MAGFWYYWYFKRTRVFLIAGALAAATLGGLYLSHNPVVSVVGLEATVEGARFGESRVGTSGSYTYSLRLDDGRTVFASDYPSRPHLKGTRVTIEQVTYKSGRIMYRFPNFRGVAGAA